MLWTGASRRLRTEHTERFFSSVAAQALFIYKAIQDRSLSPLFKKHQSTTITCKFMMFLKVF